MFLPVVKLNLIETAAQRHNGACQTDPLFHIVKYRGRHISPSQPIVSNNDGSELAESYYRSLQILLIAILSALQLLSSEPISEDGKYKLICKHTMAQSIKTAGSFPRSFSSLTDSVPVPILVLFSMPSPNTCKTQYQEVLPLLINSSQHGSVVFLTHEPLHRRCITQVFPSAQQMPAHPEPVLRKVSSC